VSGKRRTRLLARLMDGTTDLTTKRLCEVCAEVVGMSGAGIMLMAGDVPQGSLCTTGKVSALIEESQFALGEGPCIDAYHTNRPVLEPDLANPVTPRWLAFTGPVLDAGVRAIFGFPLNMGGVRLGALNLYRDERGALTDEQHADALGMADIATRAVLVMQGNAPLGQIAAELTTGADFEYIVHQASGMVAAQLDVTVGQALIRLRGYAFGNDRSLREVAEAVVARKLRFDGTGGEQDPTQ
jgi:hypothetical protein